MAWEDDQHAFRVALARFLALAVLFLHHKLLPVDLRADHINFGL